MNVHSSVTAFSARRISLTKLSLDLCLGCVIWNEIATICEAGYQAISREIYEKISENTERQNIWELYVIELYVIK